MSKAEPTFPPSALEELLVQALDVEPPQRVVTMLEDRVARAAAAGRPASRGILTRLEAPRFTLRRVGAVALAATMLMGAAVTLNLLQQAAEMMPGWRVAYERGERLGLAQTVGGYTVTLARAYADPNQLVLAFTAAGPAGTLPAVVRADVTDDQGRHYLDVAGGDLPEAPRSLAASISSHAVPPGVAGPLALRVRVDELMEVSEATTPGPRGPWIFTFSLPLHDAATVTPAQRVTAAGVPITLETVRFSPTAIRVRLAADLDAVRTPQWRHWNAEMEIRHGDGPVQPLDWESFPAAWTGQAKGEIGSLLDQADGSEIVRQTFAGIDEPAGEWTLVIRLLRGWDGTGETRDLVGPWTFRFVVP